MNNIVIGITGHRILTDQQQRKIKPVIAKAIENIIFTLTEQNNDVSFSALSPLAEGADTLFAEAAIARGLPLRVILPFDTAEYLKDFSSDAARAHFDIMYHAVADADKYILHPYTRPKDVNQLYLDLGIKMVDESNYLLAIWNEKAGNGKGGTADVVAYAKQQKKHILLINPEDEHPFINYLHPDNYNGHRSADVVDTSQTNHLTAYLAGKQKEFDASAVQYNKRYKRVWTAGFVIGLVEVLAFAVAISFDGPVIFHFVFMSIEFFSLVVILLLLFFSKSKELHREYVHYRIVSERLRIKRFFAELGFRLYKTSVSPIYFSFKEKPEYSILDNTIRLINLSAYSYLPFEKKKQWLESELIVGQYKYHEHKKEQFEQRNNMYKKIRIFLFLLFILVVVVGYIHVLFEFLAEHGIVPGSVGGLLPFEALRQLLLFLSLFIPATIAACEALKYLYEWEKIITLSAAMAAYFREQAVKLKQVYTEEALEVFINAINRDMLIENLDWEKYMHDKNEVPT